MCRWYYNNGRLKSLTSSLSFIQLSSSGLTFWHKISVKADNSRRISRKIFMMRWCLCSELDEVQLIDNQWLDQITLMTNSQAVLLWQQKPSKFRLELNNLSIACDDPFTQMWCEQELSLNRAGEMGTWWQLWIIKRKLLLHWIIPVRFIHRFQLLF